MPFTELLFIGVGLAADAFAVAMCRGFEEKRFTWKNGLLTAFFFGFFQALMPLIGWAAASLFSHLIEAVDHWIAFGILAFLGIRMIRESLKDEECRHTFDPTRLKVVLAFAIATSIDALAVGVSFAFVGMNGAEDILPAVGIIGIVSFILSMAGLLFGIRCGCGLAKKLRAELLGGVILVIIGCKILIEHLFFN